MFCWENLVRQNIKRLKPYSSARKEFSGTAEIFLDANENSFGSPLAASYNRYPDPLQSAIKEKIADLNNVLVSEIFIGNGSDEAIDLLFRIFCRPQIDNVVICPPTYGMYEVSAEINDVEKRRAPLTEGFQLDPERVKGVIDRNTKLIFVCSPNNPSGNLISREAVLDLAKSFNGIIVVDEAYIHFSNERSLVAEIRDVPNLVVLQTFSKAWGLAGLRVGLAFANEKIIEFFNNVKPPYNVCQAAQELILKALENESQMRANVSAIIRERGDLVNSLGGFSFVKKIYPTDANFVLVRTDDADRIYEFLLNQRIVVRNRNNVELCEGCLRITAGTPDQNAALLNALKSYEESIVY
jgi:histidinol-phosphate aminotransferase